MNNQVSKPIEFKSNDHTFMIKSEKGYFTVYSETNHVYPWLDKLNAHSIVKKFDLNQIQTQLKNMITYNQQTLSKKSINMSRCELLDIECIKETNKIRGYIDDAIKKTPFVKDMSHVLNDDNMISLKIFNRRQCADIITVDYIQLFRWLGESFASSEITLLNNSIYDWRVRINCNTTLCEVSTKSKDSGDCNNELINNNDLQLPKEWQNVVIDIKLHPDMYPNYPPNVNVVNPKFKNELNVKISRSKFTMLDYWTCDHTIVDVIIRTLKLLVKHGEIESLGKLDKSFNSYQNLSKQTKTLVVEISSHLDNLTPYMDLGDDHDIDNDQVFVKVSDIIASKKNAENKISKKKSLVDNGTGYGHSGAHRWDITKYRNLIDEKNNKFIVFVNSINIKLNRICDSEKGDLSCTIDIIKESQLYKFIVKIFKQVSVLEIQNEHKYYRSIFDLIHLFCLENTIGLFYDSDPNKALYNAVCNLKQRAQTSLDLDESNENANMISIIHNMIDVPYKKYISNIESDTATISAQKKPLSQRTLSLTSKNLNKIYSDTMLQYRYKITDGLHNDKSYYFCSKVQDEDSIMMKQCYKRLSSEIPSLIESMNVSENSLVIGHIDKKRPNCIRFMMDGPVDTPYSRGLFIFDIYCGSGYPVTAPEFRLMNINGYQFNPNLYADGKICLSLLNTYSGTTPHESEKWNPKLSTLSQVIISIQANIFVDQPYFNNQGYEKYRGTKDGDKNSKEYNEMVRYSTINECMLNLLRSIDNYQYLSDAITTHFYLQRDKIIQQCQKWIDDCNDTKIRNNMKQTFNDLKHELNKLTLPTIS